MNKRWHIIALTAGIALLTASCNDGGSNDGTPIVLGDSASIVTEADEQQLKDLVTDLQPVIPPSKDPEEEPAKTDTVAKPAPQEQAVAALPSGPGLKAEFGELTVMIPGLDVKIGGSSDLRKAYGASYMLNGGEINGGTLLLKPEGGEIVKVYQRYQSVVMMKSDIGDIILDALTITASWKEVNGSGNKYGITGLDKGSIQYHRANAGDIRSAVQKAARKHRVSRSKMNDMINDVRKVRSVNQSPLHGELRAVMWKIVGKDANGKPYTRQIRIDIPI